MGYSWHKLALVLMVAGASSAKDPAPAHNPVRGVVTSARTFSIGLVDEKPEAGPMLVVDGDQIKSGTSPVMFRLTGENRVALGSDSVTRIQSIDVQKTAEAANDGAYFYLSKGSIDYDAKREPLAICARDRLYVPSTPGSGAVVIRNNKVEVVLTTGTMVRSGSDPCSANATPLLLLNGVGTTAVGAAGAAGGAAGAVGAAGSAAGAAGAAGAATATATATAAAAGIGAAIPTAATVGIAAASAAGAVATAIATQSPPPQSPISPGP